MKRFIVKIISENMVSLLDYAGTFVHILKKKKEVRVYNKNT